MCQLLGMNCNVPTDINFSFDGFSKRAGLTGDHCDGFGIAFFKGKSINIFRDNLPAHISPIAQAVTHFHIKSCNVIAHIRKATQGEVNLENTHPFIRELWGENWVFAHNGNLDNLLCEKTSLFASNSEDYQIFYQPIGSTDSEKAFCFMLNQLKNYFVDKPNQEALINALFQISEYLQQYGIFNFLLSNGDLMFAYSTTDLHYLTRHAPFGKASRIDDDGIIDFREYTNESDKVTIITTLPLTKDEHWIKIPHNQLFLFQNGDLISINQHASLYPKY